MSNQFSRTALLLGEEAMARLWKSRVAVFGIGGVGGYAVEALARAGVGTLDLIDYDTVSLTNLNRQIIATHTSLGRYKVDVAAERIHDICPDITVNRHCCFYLPETAEQFDFSQYDYVIDAIDTVGGKVEIVLRARAAGIPVISAMGAGNKLDPTAFRVADLSETRVCPLARAMRSRLRRHGITHLKVVYSEEPPLEVAAHIAVCEEPPLVPLTHAALSAENAVRDRPIPGSVSFVPSVVGLILAGEVIRDLIARS